MAGSFQTAGELDGMRGGPTGGELRTDGAADRGRGTGRSPRGGRLAGLPDGVAVEADPGSRCGSRGPKTTVPFDGSSDHVGNRPLAGGAGAVPAPLAPLRGSRRVVRGVIKARPPHLRTGRDLRAHRRRPTCAASRIAAAETLWKICVPLVSFRRRQTSLEPVSRPLRAPAPCGPGIRVQFRLIDFGGSLEFRCSRPAPAS